MCYCYCYCYRYCYLCRPYRYLMTCDLLVHVLPLPGDPETSFLFEMLCIRSRPFGKCDSASVLDQKQDTLYWSNYRYTCMDRHKSRPSFHAFCRRCSLAPWTMKSMMRVGVILVPQTLRSTTVDARWFSVEWDWTAPGTTGMNPLVSLD